MPVAAILSAALAFIGISETSGRHPGTALDAAFLADAETHKGIFLE